MQKRFIENKASLLSFEANEKYAGIIPPSVYTGFDNISSVSGYTLQIGHAITGERFTDINLDTTLPRGIWVSRQGTVIKEDSPISVAISPNPNNYERWDILVAEHIHDVLSQGGTEAIYTVIPGGNQTEPTSISNTQVILGRFRVPANTTNANTNLIIWERRPIPQLGGKFPALLAENNRFTGQNSDHHATIATAIQTLNGVQKGVILGLNTANSYLVNNPTGFTLDLLPARPLGTEIVLTFNSNITLAGFNRQLQPNSDNIVGYGAGYRPLSVLVTDPNANINLLAGETAVFKMVEVVSGVNRRPHSQYWSLVGVTDATGKSLMAYSEVEGLKARMTNAEENINTVSQNLTIVSEGLSNHASNKNNPHNVTKQQVGLGNIPNNKTDNTNVDDSDVLATAKSVNSLRLALTNQISDVSDTAQQALNNALPKGAIIMWSGSVETIPTGFVLCDGRPAVNNLNIPDLRNKFIRGATDLSNSSGLDPDSRGQIATPAAVNSSGGNNRMQLTLDHMPPHSHPMPNQITIQTAGDAASEAYFRVDRNYTTRETGTVGGVNGVAQEFNLMPQWYALAFIIKVV